VVAFATEPAARIPNALPKSAAENRLHIEYFSI
jgi:hypothetical protein